MVNNGDGKEKKEGVDGGEQLVTSYPEVDKFVDKFAIELDDANITATMFIHRFLFKYFMAARGRYGKEWEQMAHRRMDRVITQIVDDLE